jgi:signal transduction histidine kinase
MYTKLLKSLKHNKLFKNIKEEDLNLPLGIDNFIFKTAGDVIYREGDSAETIFLLVSGEIRVVKERLLGTVKKIIKKSGDFLGEEDFLENMPHTSTAYVSKDCCLFVLNREQFEILTKKFENIHENISQYIMELETEESTVTSLEKMESEIRDAGFVKEGDFDFIIYNNYTNKVQDPATNLKESKELTDEQMSFVWEEVHSFDNKVKPDEIFKSILDSAMRLTHSEEGILYSVNEEKDEIRSRVFSKEGSSEICLKIGEGIAGLVAQSKELINIVNVQNDYRFNQYYDGMKGLQIRNLICSPIVKKSEEVLGVFYLVNCRYGNFNRIDEKLLEELSPFVIQAFEKVSVIENIVQQERSSLLSKMGNFLVQEIKKPILVNKRYSEYMKTKNPSAEIDHVLDMQIEHLDYINDLIQSTSDYTQGKSSLQFETCRLNQTLQEILSKLESGITRRNCQLETRLDRDTTIRLDKKGFLIACYHILRNACDAMNDNNKIVISTKLSFSEVAISFKDYGFGIPADYIGKIFDPFVSFNKKEGTGLGLSVVRNIIVNHGGRIEVESNNGEGAKFIMILPIV